MTVAATSFARSIVDGFSQLLAADNLGFAVQRTDPAKVGLFPAKLPTDVTRGVAVNYYPLGGDPLLAQSEGGVQFIARSLGDDIRDAWSLIDLIEAALLGRFPLVLPTGLTLSTLAWVAGGSLGQDDLSRWSWATNFRFSAHRPTPHRY